MTRTEVVKITRSIMRSMTKREWESWLDDIASGRSLTEICKKNKLSYGCVRMWIARNPEMKVQFEEAEKAFADFHVSECIPIADEDEDTNKAKLRIDTRLKVAAKLNKERYGDQGGITMNLGSNSLVAILSTLPRSEVPAIESRESQD